MHEPAAACACACWAARPRPQEIIDRFEPEFEKLLLVAMMLPWAGQEPGD